MSRYLADTSYWIAALNKSDELHERAAAVGVRLHGIFVTTQWILAELLDGFAATRQRRGVAAFVRTLEKSPHVVIVPATEDWFHLGLTRYEKRGDKEWSLTDCISFVVMEQMSITQALTADRHFEQAGFVALLK